MLDFSRYLLYARSAVAARLNRYNSIRSSFGAVLGLGRGPDFAENNDGPPARNWRLFFFASEEIARDCRDAWQPHFRVRRAGRQFYFECQSSCRGPPENSERSRAKFEQSPNFAQGVSGGLVLSHLDHGIFRAINGRRSFGFVRNASV